MLSWDLGTIIYEITAITVSFAVMLVCLERHERGIHSTEMRKVCMCVCVCK